MKSKFILEVLLFPHFCHLFLQFLLEFFHHRSYSAFGKIGDPNIHQAVNRIIEQRIHVKSHHFRILFNILLDEHRQAQASRFHFINDLVELIEVGFGLIKNKSLSPSFSFTLNSFLGLIYCAT